MPWLRRRSIRRGGTGPQPSSPSLSRVYLQKETRSPQASAARRANFLLPPWGLCIAFIPSGWALPVPGKPGKPRVARAWGCYRFFCFVFLVYFLFVDFFSFPKPLLSFLQVAIYSQSLSTCLPLLKQPFFFML